MPAKRFQRHTEDFICEECGANVRGNGYTDHCPNCLASKHVDNNPGDRASNCKALMFPVSAYYKDGDFVIKYKCSGCGMLKNMKCGPEDNRQKLLDLAAKKR